jgi:hypothetical protein
MFYPAARTADLQIFWNCFFTIIFSRSHECSLTYFILWMAAGRPGRGGVIARPPR